jgi:hypothetical protein
MKRMFIIAVLAASVLFSQVPTSNTQIFGEVPAGTLNGLNPNFTLNYIPVIPNSLALFRNGVRQRLGLDYTLVGNTITFASGYVPASGDQLLADYVTGSTANLLSANNLSDVSDVAAARSNLGLATVAVTGSYTDLTNKPTLGTAAAQNTTAFDVAGAAAAAQAASLPATTVLPAYTTAVSHQFITAYNSATGAFTQAQPAATDITGLAASATTDTTNASNITGGSLAKARQYSTTVYTDQANMFGNYLQTFGGNIGVSGTISSYNGISTVANGVPVIVAKADRTAQQANISPTAVYTVPAGGAGMYRMSCYIVITQTATTSSALPQCIVGYIENDSNTSETVWFTPSTNTNTLGQVNIWASSPGLAIFNAKAGTSIQYSTGSYASSGATPMQYAVHIKLEYLGN